MTSSVIIEILLALIAAAIGFVSYLQATRANREQTMLATAQAAADRGAVDAGAFARAKEIYEGALDTLRAELISTRSEIRDLRASNDSLLREASDMRISNERLRAEIALLRAEFNQKSEGHLCTKRR